MAKLLHQSICCVLTMTRHRQLRESEQRKGDAAGPDLCTYCPELCALHPDLCFLRLWCYPSINQRKYSTCTHGGGHWLQLALVAFFLQSLVHILHLHSSNLHCVVGVCGGGSCMWM